MKATFTLKLQPFSINRTYYRDKRHKTQDFRDWEMAALASLRNNAVQQQIDNIRQQFDPNLHGFVVKLKFLYPRSVLLNKQGQISSRAEDLSNIEKTLLDVLFLPKHHVQTPPWGAPNFNADDKYVLRLSSEKAVSPDDKHHIQVTVWLKNLSSLSVGP